MHCMRRPAGSMQLRIMVFCRDHDVYPALRARVFALDLNVAKGRASGLVGSHFNLCSSAMQACWSSSVENSSCSRLYSETSTVFIGLVPGHCVPEAGFQQLGRGLPALQYSSCNGAGSGGLPVADRTRTEASRRRAAGTGQGRRRADGTQRGRDKGGGEQTARSGREVWERKGFLLLGNVGNKLLREEGKGRRKERKKWATAPFKDIRRPLGVTPHSFLPHS